MVSLIVGNPHMGLSGLVWRQVHRRLEVCVRPPHAKGDMVDLYQEQTKHT